MRPRMETAIARATLSFSIPLGRPTMIEYLNNCQGKTRLAIDKFCEAAWAWSGNVHRDETIAQKRSRA
jgi:hypothetical protein